MIEPVKEDVYHNGLVHRTSDIISAVLSPVKSYYYSEESEDDVMVSFEVARQSSYMGVVSKKDTRTLNFKQFSCTRTYYNQVRKEYEYHMIKEVRRLEPTCFSITTKQEQLPDIYECNSNIVDDIMIQFKRVLGNSRVLYDYKL